MTPTGPWSEGTLLFDPSTDPGYGTFMHLATQDGAVADDGLAEPGQNQDNVSGGEYGPYFVPQWFTDDAPGVYSLVYTLSSWVPYKSHLMRTTFAVPGAVVPATPAKGLGLPKAALVNGDFATGDTQGWTSSGDAVAVIQAADGHYFVSTYVPPLDESAESDLWQEFVVDATTSELDFFVSGGTSYVELWNSGDRLRASRGQNDNNQVIPVAWRLEEYRGQLLRVVIHDQDTGPWGFVNAWGFSLH
jgi:hypothetical protein